MPFSDNATRAQALTLKAIGVLNAKINAITGIQLRTLYTLLYKVKERRYNPNISKKILNIYIKNSLRSRRLAKQTSKLAKNVISKIYQDRYSRKKTYTQIAIEVRGVLDTIVQRILRIAGYRKTKPTRKLGLIVEIKKARL